MASCLPLTHRETQHSTTPSHPPYIDYRNHTLGQPSPQAPRMCFCEVLQHQNCALLDDRQHNPAGFIHAERGSFADFAGYQYDIAWANQNPGYVPCRTVLLGDMTPAEYLVLRDLPLIHRIPVAQDCQICNRSVQDYSTGHVITWKENSVHTIQSIKASPHVYDSRYAGKCSKCAKEASFSLSPPQNGGWTEGGPPENDSFGKPQPVEVKTGARGPPGSEVLKGKGWDKI